MGVYRLSGRVDSGNAAAWEAELQAVAAENTAEGLVLDAEELDYISSAGLRVLLRLRKAMPSLRVIHVQPAVYETLEVTGFTELLEVEKALRRVSVEGCPMIGQGAHGSVYRVAPDAVVKVYRPDISLKAIRRERELSRWAFVRGIPTAIPYDTVRVGEQYGAMYELLDAENASDYVRASAEHLDRFIRQSVSLMKQTHAVEVKPGELPDMKTLMLGWAERLRHKLPDGQWERLRRLLEAVPDSHTLLHADFHLKNMMVCDGELMLIDMDTLCAGDPIFELSSIYNSYREFPDIDPAAAAFLGIDVETAERIWSGTLAEYYKDTDAQTRRAAEEKSRLFGCVRIVDFMERGGPPEVRERAIRHCIKDISELLNGLC